jgi:hypothetical protein
MESTNQVPLDIAAEHYVDGYRRGINAERDRILRIIHTELETTRNIARKNGTEATRAHAAVQVKLGLLYEMVKD